MPMAPAKASPPAGIQGGNDGADRWLGLSAATTVAVVTVNVLEAGEPPEGVVVAGENEQAVCAGSEPQENFTVPA